MKKVLFAGLLAIAGVSVSAQNLIKNEKFATEVKTKVTNANKATAGEWFIMNNEADGAVLRRACAHVPNREGAYYQQFPA